VRGALEDYLPRATRHRDSVDEADLEALIEWITDEVETDVNGRLRVLEREHYDHDLATDGGNDRGDGPRTDGGTSPDCPDCGHDLDTEETNDALAADEGHEYFCPRCGRLFGRVETDGGTSPACPDCGSATISRRQPGHAMSDPWVDTRWRCGDCGHRFDEAGETRANPGRSGLAGRLDDADADDLDRGAGPRTDGGESESEPETVWTLTCLDCELTTTITAAGHPRDGPPDTVERTVTRHKHSTDQSHVVRVAGRLADRCDDIDPSLMTDGGQSKPRGGADVLPFEEDEAIEVAYDATQATQVQTIRGIVIETGYGGGHALVPPDTAFVRCSEVGVESDREFRVWATGRVESLSGSQHGSDYRRLGRLEEITPVFADSGAQSGLSGPVSDTGGGR
jgi:DNA-directed RNA polymerase subunit RPC12/RpoP